MTTASVAEFRQHLSGYLGRAQYGHERVVVTRNGKPAAALVSIEDLELLQALEDRLDLARAEAALRAAETEGTIPWEKLKSDLGLS